MDKKYEEYFGFTESETKELLEYYDLSLTKKVKEMYNGYDFGGTPIYNPWSILNYAKRIIMGAYLVNTSGNDLIRSLLLKTDGANKSQLEKLVLGETLEFTYNDKITYQDFDNYNSLNTILNVMFSSEYLTIDKHKQMTSEIKYVKIPNLEVKKLITSIMSDLTKKTTYEDLFIKINKFNNALEKNDKVSMEQMLNKMFTPLSYMDSQKYFYHAYTLGIFKSLLDNNDYIIKSNREAGSGRFDVMIREIDNSVGYVIEFKLASAEEEMETSAKDAINQMKDKEYYKELELEGVNNIKEIAMVFHGKKVIVR